MSSAIALTNTFLASAEPRSNMNALQPCRLLIKRMLLTDFLFYRQGGRGFVESEFGDYEEARLVAHGKVIETISVGIPSDLDKQNKNKYIQIQLKTIYTSWLTQYILKVKNLSQIK